MQSGKYQNRGNQGHRYGFIVLYGESLNNAWLHMPQSFHLSRKSFGNQLKEDQKLVERREEMS
jgi:hypothetical protein